MKILQSQGSKTRTAPTCYNLVGIKQLASRKLQKAMIYIGILYRSHLSQIPIRVWYDRYIYIYRILVSYTLSLQLTSCRRESHGDFKLHPLLLLLAFLAVLFYSGYYDTKDQRRKIFKCFDWEFTSLAANIYVVRSNYIKPLKRNLLNSGRKQAKRISPPSWVSGLSTINIFKRLDSETFTIISQNIDTILQVRNSVLSGIIFILIYFIQVLYQAWQKGKKSRRCNFYFLYLFCFYFYFFIRQGTQFIL